MILSHWENWYGGDNQEFTLLFNFIPTEGAMFVSMFVLLFLTPVTHEYGVKVASEECICDVSMYSKYMREYRTV